MGYYLYPNFITPDEEAELLAWVDKGQEWKRSKWNGKHLVKHWGVKTDFTLQECRPPNPALGELLLPKKLEFLVDRMQAQIPEFLGNWIPNECNANRYVKRAGHFIGAHFDSRNLSGEIIVNLSLGSDAKMTFSKTSSETNKVLLPRRSLSIMSKESRYTWKHSIANADLLGETRVSFNWRKAKV